MLTRQEYSNVSEALNSRFADMHKAFQYVDIDGSGTLNREEIDRALKLWNVPLPPGKLDALMAMCDTTGDGEIGYAEFVHALARDTTTRSVLAKQEKKKQESKEERHEREALHAATEGINTRFTRMRDAFKWVDVDNSGTVSLSELRRAIDLLGVPMTEEKLMVLWNACDTNANGEISYAEFVNAFARDTAEQKVAPSGPAFERKSAEEEQHDKLMLMAEDSINQRFADMRKAFKYVDLDNSGTVNRQELDRALKLMGIELPPERIEYLWRKIDRDGDGEVDYKEFVDAFARDTVMPGAMDEVVEKPPTREPTPIVKEPAPPTLRELRLMEKHRQRQERAAEAERQRLLEIERNRPRQITPTIQGRDEQAAQDIAVAYAKEGLNSRFADMRKAFKYVDLDNSGTVSRSELENALSLWNVPMTQEKLDDLWHYCDENGNGEISYAEFVNALARDVAISQITPAGPSFEKESIEDEAREAHRQEVERGIHSRFSNMRKAFQWADLDNSGMVSRKELDRALDLMNISIPPDELDYMWAEVDRDGSGEIDYEEFIKVFSGDAVQMDHSKKVKTAKVVRKY